MVQKWRMLNSVPPTIRDARGSDIRDVKGFRPMVGLGRLILLHMIKGGGRHLIKDLLDEILYDSALPFQN
jgi:hypothetical protein